ncbi:hypothetical protein Pse7367_0710 [Thalassoporum mexicanum PCC 7367]|uniref:ParE family toxin-like protein n=1 Tax=Thalassoporum mexicanum TaxID=3457544 RepID=UPI00029FB7D8|nr:hypothetical protein [Pseudanabaena sp. PCC 7367]AFY69012.1 hypothetical protein Pse7367_0710 [Pseudanabaena sp. PCC 7367]
MKSRTNQAFRDLLAQLPKPVQDLARKNYLLWQKDPRHKSLRFKQVHKEKQIYSIRIGRKFRALGELGSDGISWYWIGSHEQYDQEIRKL